MKLCNFKIILKLIRVIDDIIFYNYCYFLLIGLYVYEYLVSKVNVSFLNGIRIFRIVGVL